MGSEDRTTRSSVKDSVGPQLPDFSQQVVILERFVKIKPRPRSKARRKIGALLGISLSANRPRAEMHMQHRLARLLANVENTRRLRSVGPTVFMHSDLNPPCERSLDEPARFAV